jgi:hypothetical protein
MSKALSAIQAVADLGCELENTQANLEAVKQALISANRSKDDMRVRLDTAVQQIANMSKRMRELEEMIAAPLFCIGFETEVDQCWPRDFVTFDVRPERAAYRLMSRTFVRLSEDDVRDIARKFGEKVAEDIGGQLVKQVAAAQEERRQTKARNFATAYSTGWTKRRGTAKPR